MSKRILSAVLLVLLVAGVVLTGCGGKKAVESPKADNKPLKLGFVPSQTAAKLADTAKPFADMLSKELGRPVEPYVIPDFAGLVEAMGAGQVDIGFLNSLGYVLAAKQGYAKVVVKSVRNGSKTYRGQILVKADSPIKTAADLKGKKFGFVDPASTSGYLFAAAWMKKQGVDPQKDVQGVSLGGHDKAVEAVLKGDVDAAASFENAETILKTITQKYPDAGKQLRHLVVTADIPNDTVSVRADMDPQMVEKVKVALLKLGQDPEARKSLKDIYPIDEFAEAQDSDYDNVRKVAETLGLNLEVLQSK
mgnify:CR=1 FL=1